MEESAKRTWGIGPGLLDSAWRYKWLIAVLAVLGAALGYVLALQQPTTYETSARVLLSDPRNVGLFSEIRPAVGDPSRYVRNQKELITYRPVLERAAEILGDGTTATEVLGAVRAEAVFDLDVIEVFASADEAEAAAAIANAVTAAYEDVVRRRVGAAADQAIAELEAVRDELEQALANTESQLQADPDDPVIQAEREAAASQLATVTSRVRQLSVDASLFGSGVELVEPAEVPTSPASPRPRASAAAGGLLGVVLGLSLGWWLHGRKLLFDPRQDPAEILGAPLLGEVPRFDAATTPLPAASAPHSAAAEAYQFLVVALTFALRAQDGKTVLLTSAHPGEGKTVTAANLGIVAKRDGRRVLVVDGDGRARGMERLIGPYTGAGLAYLASPSMPFEWGVTQADIDPDIRLPVVGMSSDEDQPDDMASFLRSATFRAAMERIRSGSELVVVDSPPLLAVVDAFEMAEHVDAVVLVITPKTSTALLREVRRRMDLVNKPLLGYVLNMAATSDSPYAYGYAQDQEEIHRPAEDVGWSVPPVPGRGAEGDGRAEDLDVASVRRSDEPRGAGLDEE